MPVPLGTGQLGDIKWEEEHLEKVLKNNGNPGYIYHPGYSHMWQGLARTLGEYMQEI